ncbi:MAG: hypothetical protein UR69_C0003G0042 [Candidatus Moranbacteria bacterium GW2011_GWE2_35_2-]|nr:MAG: hypothetical protein UR69_C0003G0042 [Candidatus Moranbacteria bacterium GW2011_GWE2_35_2-]KKQ22059.1 MAG: hypothetical protein US37_C0004G0018 [Candidatus Moranbacteria bacterium GW2011_GWF2_37_11]KKQ29187.1 MAG: hypothetical protein US44_C0003G0099 [Candidatus Moranbacteria bacterium GW2011_GWD1_37_17]KKQ31172.1 MAG: hypothetical protein US47_C0001G0405 [Candidatus Moranbacteria bacterium GW2011_GWE1_37_24]KKQ47422.1 MAG: hypothetical protein US66_C0012G0038 [Candidatus Moranbacteria 
MKKCVIGFLSSGIAACIFIVVALIFAIFNMDSGVATCLCGTAFSFVICVMFFIKFYLCGHSMTDIKELLCDCE